MSFLQQPKIFDGTVIRLIWSITQPCEKGRSFMGRRRYPPTDPRMAEPGGNRSKRRKRRSRVSAWSDTISGLDELLVPNGLLASGMESQ